MSFSLAEKNRQRHALRQIIKGEEALQAVMEISDHLRKIGFDEAIDPSPARVGALKAAADIKLRVLDKVLPDLKSVEHELGEGLTSLTEDELRDRIRQLADAIDPRLLGGTGAVVAGDSATIQ
jgi:hypothetical protein